MAAQQSHDEPFVETIDWFPSAPEAKAEASRLARYITMRGTKGWLIGVKPLDGGHAVVLCRDTRGPRPPRPRECQHAEGLSRA
jgi:hypothetical protein